MRTSVIIESTPKSTPTKSTPKSTPTLLFSASCVLFMTGFTSKKETRFLEEQFRFK